MELIPVYADKLCVECGGEFTPRNGRQKTCSDVCKKSRTTRQEHERYDSSREVRMLYTREWYKTNRDRELEGSRVNLYGVTNDMYDKMLADQGGCCAICFIPASGRNLAVDHDHACCPGRKSCGKCVRSLLCKQCNRMLGFAKDDAGLLRRAAAYVEASHD